jgi:hypothetical protein
MRVRFTEKMCGFHTPGSPAYDAGYVLGQRQWHRLSFQLTIGTEKLEAVLRDPIHRLRAEGYVRCREVHAADMPVEGGTFELFAPGASRGRTLMRYRLPISTGCGRMTLLGFKDVGNDLGVDAWPDTTTLYTRLVYGYADFADGVANEFSRGILRVDAPMFVRQITTFRGTPLGIARFLLFFGTGLRRTYGRAPRKDAVR